MACKLICYLVNLKNTIYSENFDLNLYIYQSQFI